MITVDEILPDAEFGHLYIRTNVRARRYIYRPAKDGTPQIGLLITVPVGYRREEVLASIDKMRPQLHEMLKKAIDADSAKTRRIDWDFNILSDCLHVTVVKGNDSNFYVHHEKGEFLSEEKGESVIKPAEMQLICPLDADFDLPGLQKWLEKVLVEGVRKHAQVQLLPRLLRYAQQYGVELHEVKVNKSTGRWGSCSARLAGDLTKRKVYNINLSLFTLLLPLPLQRLVLLHELTHTRHMDHSIDFHRDLDAWLDGKEKELEMQLKAYSPALYSFAGMVPSTSND